MRNHAWIASLLVIFASQSLAAETTPPPAPPAAPHPAARQHSAPGARVAPSVLNFDADVIEGEKTNPDLFIQLGNQQPSLEAVIYGRKNFNEFQKHEAPWRPVYREIAPSTSPVRKTTRPAK